MSVPPGPTLASSNTHTQPPLEMFRDLQDHHASSALYYSSSASQNASNFAASAPHAYLNPAPQAPSTMYSPYASGPANSLYGYHADHQDMSANPWHVQYEQQLQLQRQLQQLYYPTMPPQQYDTPAGMMYYPSTPMGYTPQSMMDVMQPYGGASVYAQRPYGAFPPPSSAVSHAVPAIEYVPTNSYRQEITPQQEMLPQQTERPILKRNRKQLKTQPEIPLLEAIPEPVQDRLKRRKGQVTKGVLPPRTPGHVDVLRWAHNWFDSLRPLWMCRSFLPSNGLNGKTQKRPPKKSKKKVKRLTEKRKKSQASLGVFAVEKILRSRHVKGREEFLIKWEGYGPSECTWEPTENLAEPLVTEFRQRTKKQEKRAVSSVPPPTVPPPSPREPTTKAKPAPPAETQTLQQSPTDNHAPKYAKRERKPSTRAIEAAALEFDLEELREIQKRETQHATTPAALPDAAWEEKHTAVAEEEGDVTGLKHLLFEDLLLDQHEIFGLKVTSGPQWVVSERWSLPVLFRVIPTYTPADVLPAKQPSASDLLDLARVVQRGTAFDGGRVGEELSSAPSRAGSVKTEFNQFEAHTSKDLLATIGKSRAVERRPQELVQWVDMGLPCIVLSSKRPLILLQSDAFSRSSSNAKYVHTQWLKRADARTLVFTLQDCFHRTVAVVPNHCVAKSNSGMWAIDTSRPVDALGDSGDTLLERIGKHCSAPLSLFRLVVAPLSGSRPPEVVPGDDGFMDHMVSGRYQPVTRMVLQLYIIGPNPKAGEEYNRISSERQSRYESVKKGIRPTSRVIKGSSIDLTVDEEVLDETAADLLDAGAPRQLLRSPDHQVQLSPLFFESLRRRDGRDNAHHAYGWTEELYVTLFSSARTSTSAALRLDKSEKLHQLYSRLMRNNTQTEVLSLPQVMHTRASVDLEFAFLDLDRVIDNLGHGASVSETDSGGS